MSDPFSNEVCTYESADAALRGTLSVLKGSSAVEAVNTGAEKVQVGTREQLGFSFTLSNSRHRIAANPSYKFDLSAAVARFVWMIGGNDRLADIKFYVDAVKDFTDDGLTVPGSSYGARIRHPQPGIDQLRGVIARLRSDHASRRASVVIWQPTDAVRESNDIPCAFGMFFHIRDELLHTQVIMRSNNATVLLPFNMFEFTMMSELVASEVGVGLGQTRYMAASMHVYDNTAKWADQISSETEAGTAEEMEKMPAEPLKSAEALAVFDTELRHASTSINDETAEEWAEDIAKRFDAYWSQLALSLLFHVAKQNCSSTVQARILDRLNPSLRKLVSINEQNDAQANVSGELTDLFENGGSNVIPFDAERLRGAITEIDNEGDSPVTALEFLDMQSHLNRVAARSSSWAESVSTDEVRKALDMVRGSSPQAE